ncbi:MAG: MBL fold metallo-hydrolase, partial [Pseudomonadota bacterium]
KLSRMGFPMERLEALYLTHLHSDHIDGLGELLLQAWIAGQRSAPLPVYGPEGAQRVVDAFNDAYAIDRGYRIAHHGTDVANPDGFGGAANEILMPDGPTKPIVVLEDGDLKISAIKVDHAPVAPAFGFRIDYKDRSIALSGDTVYHPGFVAAAKGVDVMFHEALDPEMVSRIGETLAERGQASTAKIMTDILDYHTTPEDAARAADAAGVSQLVLYHIVPPLPTSALNTMFLGTADENFAGQITVGEDGLMITLPAGSDIIRHSQTF